jgi:hypothetical protein
MSDQSELHVDVEEDEIVVTKPGTRFLLAYRKSVGSTAARDDA